MIKSFAFAFAAALAWSAPANAQSFLFEYYSLLGPVDAVNSSGVPLNDLCAIVQQDRANWHRFGLREPADGPDPYFSVPARRAQIAGSCVFDPTYFAGAGPRIRSGTRSFYVRVQAFGPPGRVTRLVITEGAG